MITSYNALRVQDPFRNANTDMAAPAATHVSKHHGPTTQSDAAGTKPEEVSDIGSQRLASHRGWIDSDMGL